MNKEKVIDLLTKESSTLTPINNNQHDLSDNEDTLNQISDSFTFRIDSNDDASSSSNSSDVSSINSEIITKSSKKRKTKKIAKCWNYFTGVKNEASDDNIKLCILCLKEVSTCNNTTNAWNHLKANHLKEYEMALGKQQLIEN